MDDNSLVILVQHGDTRAETILCNRYWNFSLKLGTKSYFKYTNSGISSDEFTSVAFSSLAIAIKKFDESCDSFHNYWHKIAVNAIQDYVNSNAYFAGARAFGDICYDGIDVEYEDHVSMENFIGELDDKYTKDELSKKILEFIYSKESKFNYSEVFVAYYMIFYDYKVDDLMKLTGWAKHKTYFIMKTVRDKISTFLKNGYFSI